MLKMLQWRNGKRAHSPYVAYQAASTTKNYRKKQRFATGVMREMERDETAANSTSDFNRTADPGNYHERFVGCTCLIG